MTFDLAHALSNFVVCQKRTGRHKQFVFIDPSNVDVVYKGPYSEERLATMIERSEKFSQWRTPHVVLPDLDKVLTGTGGYYLSYPNISKHYALDLPSCIVNKESFSDYTYRVMTRVGVVKMSDAVKTKANDWIYANVRSLTLSLIHCYLLQVGDIHTANILVDVSDGSKQIYVIDFDENRSDNKDKEIDDFFYMSKSPAKACAIKWLDSLKENYLGLIEDLTKLLPLIAFDEIILPRFNHAMSILKKLAGVASPKSIAVTKPVQSPKPIGSMHWNKHQRGSLTYSGLAIDVVKSGIQKYVRRGICEKALMCAFEMYRMAEVGGVGVQTNLYTRLVVIACEDIGPANLPLVTLVLDICFRDLRKPEELAALVQLMCASPKTRIMSHIWRAFVAADGIKIARSKNVRVDDENDILTPSADIQIPWLDSDPFNETLRNYAFMFAKRLTEGDLNCVVWLGKYMNLVESNVNLKLTTRTYKFQHVTKSRRQTSPMVIIWQIIKPYLNLKVWELLFNTYLEHNENRPFIMTAVTCALYGLNGINTEVDNFEDLVKTWLESSIFQQLTSGQYELVIDPYVIDKHTAEGRKNKKTADDFRHEGAFVNNQDPTFHLPLLEEIYKM